MNTEHIKVQKNVFVAQILVSQLGHPLRGLKVHDALIVQTGQHQNRWIRLLADIRVRAIRGDVI